jgi:cytidine deaminase
MTDRANRYLDECARHAPLLRALARGRAPADAVVGLRAHLRACGACRARLAELRSEHHQVNRPT